MKYNISINQPKMIEHNLNVNQWCILDVISVAPTWCKAVIVDDEVYYWVARQKIAEELKSLDLKPDTIYRHIKNLVSLKFLEYEKSGKKDLIRLSKKGKELFSTMSEINPSHYVGNKSENTMSEINPTYNNTSYNNTINIALPKIKPKDFKYDDSFTELWDILRTGDKWKAFISYKKRVKEGYSHEHIKKIVEAEKIKTFAIRHFSTVLNGDIDEQCQEPDRDNNQHYSKDGTLIKGNFS